MTADVDPLSLQVFANLFSSVADEMGVTLQRTAYSPNITVRRDFSCALFDAEGQLLAQAAHIPVHLGAMPLAMRAVRARLDLGPGDVVIMNDPYEGGTHLPDISLVSAAFDADGRRLGYVMSRAHHADVGGMTPGSMPLSTEIYAEGMVIPPLLLAVEGKVQESLLSLLLRNVRTPEERRGDLEAQLAAQRTGEQRLVELAARYGEDTLRAHAGALHAYAEGAMRALIQRIPPGEYAFSDAMDGDGQGAEDVPIQVTVRREPESDGLTLDFTGTAAQCRGSINAPPAVTTAATLYVLRCLQEEDFPVNEGSLRPLRFVLPPASVASAASPAAVAAGNVETSQRIVDVLFGALAAALPTAVPAASQGTMNNVAMGGSMDGAGRPWAYYETMGGGMGARPRQDGMSGVHDHMSNTLNTPVEVLESTYPVRVLSYCLRTGSGGSGRFNGGEGVERIVEVLAPVTLTLLTERRRLSPYGLAGGEPGQPGENRLRSAGKWRSLPPKATVRVGAGDAFAVASPGGGGWGVCSPAEGAGSIS